MRRLLGTYKDILFITMGWWAFWLLASSLALHRIGLSWCAALTEAGITVVVLAIMGIIIIHVFKYYRQLSGNFLLVAVDIVLMTAATGKLLHFIFSRMHEGDVWYMEHIMPVMPLRGQFYFLMITLLVVVCWLRNHYLELSSSRQRQEEAETLMRDAELARLRQQLQPHFLFNSLNSISALAGSKPEQARKMIQQLSDFLRGTLRNDDQQLVTLEEELKHLNLYLEIEKVRFGHRLSTTLICSDKAEQCKLPSLLLQPIVENAVKFGLYDTTGEITISIEAREMSNYLEVTVKNPFDPATAKPRQGTGFGLTSVQRRLFLLYARKDLLEITTHESTFTTLIKIPQAK
ncbi:MAG: sensor histidine kinase [Flavobacteriales bacterium]